MEESIFIYFIFIYIYIYIYMCTKCGSTGSRKLIKLSKPCENPSQTGEYNLKAYLRGKAPAGYPGWPYKEIYLMENVILKKCSNS